MIYAQQNSGQKLHIAYKLPSGGLTKPLCGRKVSGYRMTINAPLGNSCKNCRKRLNSNKFNLNSFLRPYFN